MATSGQNHYELFALPVSFRVDQDELTAQARKLLGKWHPDRFSGASDAEKRQAVQMTSFINEALETLQKPLPRAAYLLKLRGTDPEAFRQSDLGSEFLLQQMALRDQLEEAADNDDLDALETLKKQMQELREESYQAYSDALENDDLTAAKSLFHQLQFVEKLLVEINRTEERLLDY